MELNIFSVDFSDESGPNHVGLFRDQKVAVHVSKGNGAYSKDADITPKQIFIFDTVEEFVDQTGKKVLSSDQIKERLKESALAKLTQEERDALGY